MSLCQDGCPQRSYVSLLMAEKQMSVCCPLQPYRQSVRRALQHWNHLMSTHGCADGGIPVLAAFAVALEIAVGAAHWLTVGNVAVDGTSLGSVEAGRAEGASLLEGYIVFVTEERLRMVKMVGRVDIAVGVSGSA